jgi:hypothetical protein
MASWMAARSWACEHGRWTVRDQGIDNGVRQDGVRRTVVVLEAGMEIGVGVTTLIAESERSIALRGFVARLLGWGEDRAAVVDQALRSIRLGATFRAGLVLCGESDMVPIARAPPPGLAR